MKTRLALILIVSLGASVLWYSQLKLRELKVKAPMLVEPAFVNLNPKVVSLLTLGHEKVYQLYLYLYSLQVLTEDTLKSQPPEEVLAWFTKVYRHPLPYETLYIFTCFTFIVDLKAPEHCKPIMTRAIEVHPESWIIPLTQGYVSLFKQLDLEDAYKFYALAAEKKNVPNYIKNVAKKIKSREILENSEVMRLRDQMREIEGKIKKNVKPKLKQGI